MAHLWHHDGPKLFHQIGCVNKWILFPNKYLHICSFFGPNYLIDIQFFVCQMGQLVCPKRKTFLIQCTKGKS